VIELFSYLQRPIFAAEIPQIVVGDLNTYYDFEWPMMYLTGVLPVATIKSDGNNQFNQKRYDMTKQRNRKQWCVSIHSPPAVEQLKCHGKSTAHQRSLTRSKP
jgi:hypothetical protein